MTKTKNHHLHANNFYELVMFQKMLVKKSSFEVDDECPKNLHDLQSDLPFSPERMKTTKCNKLVCNLHDKKTMFFT